jgi:hypothetical protein
MHTVRETVNNFEQADSALCETCSAYLVFGLSIPSDTTIHDIVMTHLRFHPEHDITLIGPVNADD